MQFLFLKIRKNFFFYLITILILVIGIISYNHFFIKQDYIVWYHASCDPSAHKCFVDCGGDSACAKPDYYSEIQKYEPDLYKECGKDITNCEASNQCLQGDRECSVTYCDKNITEKVCDIPAQQNNTNNINS